MKFGIIYWATRKWHLLPAGRVIQIFYDDFGMRTVNCLATCNCSSVPARPIKMEF